MHPNHAAETLPTHDMPSIVSGATESAIHNLCKPALLQSLWQTKKYLKYGSAGTLSNQF